MSKQTNFVRTGKFQESENRLRVGVKWRPDTHLLRPSHKTKWLMLKTELKLYDWMAENDFHTQLRHIRVCTNSPERWREDYIYFNDCKSSIEADIITVQLEMFLIWRLTKNSHSYAADSGFSTGCVRDGALISTAVFRGGFQDAEGVDDPVRRSLLRLNCI